MSKETGSIFNCTQAPVVIDGHGHSLGGGERLDGVNLNAERVAAHLAGGRLVGTPDPEPKTKAKTTPATTTEA